MSQSSVSGFDPAQHVLSESHYFEDLTLGQRFNNPSRTLGDGNFAAFQLASGDNHPIHYDVEYCRRKGHREMVAHGATGHVLTSENQLKAREMCEACIGSPHVCGRGVA